MSISEQLPGMKPGHRLRNISIGIVYFFVIMVVLGAVAPSPEGGSDTAPETTTAAADAVTTTTDVETDGGAATTTETTTETTTKATTETTTVEPAEDGDSYEYSDNGNSVTDAFTAEGGLVVLDFQHDGDSNFQVQAVNSDGETEEYLVNEIGSYDGAVALYLPGDDYRLDITADGSWSADITQPRFNENDIEDFPASADGEHAAWFGPFEFEGGEEVTFEIENDAQAGVWLATHEGEKVDLLHNEIGPYEGSTLVTDSGVGLIIVDTDSADWKIEIKR